MVNIKIKDNTIIVNCDSYILLKDAEKTYMDICDFYVENSFEVKEFLIHEHVMDVICDYIEKTSTIVYSEEKSITFFGLPVKTFKGYPINHLC